MDNQFLSSPLLTSGARATRSAANSIQKDQLIKGLELKNAKLKREITKIQNTIDESLRSEPEEKPKERQPIMRSDQNQASMMKELTNCYKKIKMYEYEISKIEESNGAANVIQQAKQIESVIKEKKAMADRLKLKLHADQKLISENIKKLNNGSQQQAIEKKIKSLSDEIKFLREKQKEQEAKDELRQGNMKKQYQFVKKLQNQILEGGISGGELEEIKMRAIRSLQPNIAESKVTALKKQELEPAIQDRTVDAFRQITNQIKLLEKMQADYEKKLVEAEAEKDKAVEINSASRDRLLQIEDEIEKVDKQIMIQKGKILPSNMKPLRPLRSVSSHYMTNDKNKKTPAKNMSMNKGVKSLTHILKHDEVGFMTDKGQRFTDRNILGKTNLMTKMTGLTVFTNCQTKAISGVQATYNHNKRGGEYLKKDREAKERQYDDDHIVCQEGEWIKSVTGTLNPLDRLESLNVITNKGQSKRFGQPKTTNKSFNFDIGPSEVPVCIFGSLLVFKEIGKLQNSVVEHFGIEIYEEKSKVGHASADQFEI